MTQYTINLYSNNVDNTEVKQLAVEFGLKINILEPKKLQSRSIPYAKMAIIGKDVHLTEQTVEDIVIYHGSDPVMLMHGSSYCKQIAREHTWNCGLPTDNGLRRFLEFAVEHYIK